MLAVVPPDLEISPNPTEVAQWFEAPVDFVFDPANHDRAIGSNWEGGDAGRYYRDHVAGASHLGGDRRASSSISRGGLRVAWLSTLPACPTGPARRPAALVAALGPGQCPLCRRRGARHACWGIEVKDIDIATPLEPREVIAGSKPQASRSSRPGSTTAPSPRSCAVARSRSPRCATTSSTDGRRATVAFAQDWQDDAARRDFTINALYADPATRRNFRLFRRAGRPRGAAGALHRRCPPAHPRGSFADPALLPVSGAVWLATR